jgi:LuxR family transcriptional regulator, maltose regulon positive regulatory protein
MPKIARYTLVWSPLHQAYELHASQDNGIRDIILENPAWLAWVSQISSFAFHGRNGSYTAWKECKQRGEGYWYASTRIGGKMTKRYLGRVIDLTLPRLEQVAQELRLHMPDTLLEKERSHHVTKQQADSPADRKITVALTLSQTNPLLATKLHVPRPRPRLVHRSRLIQRLQQGMERVLTLLSAPVGFGKSTLLSDWLSSGNIPVAWLSLDSQDNESTRFLSYLFAALQTYDPHLAVTGQVLGEQLQPPSLEAMLTLLINDLLMRRADAQKHFVLVLDNYQVITDQSIHQALSFLLDHLPPQLHLVLATREDPPLPLAHLRGRDDLLELRAADLRFTQEEANTFLIDVMGLPLSMEESALLQARTEGWITGLQLAAFSLQGRDDPGAFIRAFSGSDRYVVDYLLEEVLNRQSEAVQDFLLHTCILDRLRAPLCDAVRQQGGSRALLDFLERTNLFLAPLNDDRYWYRYNRLFAEALRQLLRQTAPTLVPTLHLRASCWYEQHGLFAEAASQASAAHVPQSAPYVELLTVREREVLQLLLDGASNREIAHHLVLSVNTAKKHVLNICGKLNVRSRAQVIAKARTLHLL